MLTDVALHVYPLADIAPREKTVILRRVLKDFLLLCKICVSPTLISVDTYAVELKVRICVRLLVFACARSEWSMQKASVFDFLPPHVIYCGPYLCTAFALLWCQPFSPLRHICLQSVARAMHTSSQLQNSYYFTPEGDASAGTRLAPGMLLGVNPASGACIFLCPPPGTSLHLPLPIL